MPPSAALKQNLAQIFATSPSIAPNIYIRLKGVCSAAWHFRCPKHVHYTNALGCAGMDCPRVRYPQFNDTVENELAQQGYQVLTGASEQVGGWLAAVGYFLARSPAGAM